MYSWCGRLKDLFILDSCLSIVGPSNPVSAPRRKDSGSKLTCWRSGDACETLLQRWNFLQTSTIWITRVISSAACSRTLSWWPCRELASYRSCMTSLLQYEWCFLSASRRSLAEELALSSSFLKNFRLTRHQCCLIDWLIIMGVCSISEDSKEARPHYGVPHTKEVLPGNTESHGLCFVQLRCERGCIVLSFLAEKNSRPKHEIRYTRLVPTKIANYSCAQWLWIIHRIVIISASASISSDEYLIEDGSYPSTRGSNSFSFSAAAKATNHIVCNTVSSTWNCESVGVLYRGGPI